MSLCPTCFSEIGIWTDDPILTPLGLSGEDYIGFTEPNVKHIQELQDNRTTAAIQLGLTPYPFTPVIKSILSVHINELRSATEVILSSLGSNLELYFNYDKYGHDMRPGQHKMMWSDGPRLPVGYNTIKAIHIEDLRHPITPIKASIIVHCHNPEGKEVNSITGIKYFPGARYCYLYEDDIWWLGYSPWDSETHNKPIELTRPKDDDFYGPHTITAVFNGIVLTQDIIVTPFETPVVTFTFPRTNFDYTSFLENIDFYVESSNNLPFREVISEGDIGGSGFGVLVSCGSGELADAHAEAGLQVTWSGDSYSFLYRGYARYDMAYVESWVFKSKRYQVPSVIGDFNNWFLQCERKTGNNRYWINAYEEITAGDFKMFPAFYETNPWYHSFTIGIDGGAWAHIYGTYPFAFFYGPGSGIFTIKWSSIPYDIDGQAV